MKELYRRTFAISDFSVKKNPFNIVNFRYTIRHRYYCKIKKNQSSHVLHIWFTKGCITVVKGIMFIIAGPRKKMKLLVLAFVLPQVCVIYVYLYMILEFFLKFIVCGLECLDGCLYCFDILALLYYFNEQRLKRI